MESITEQPLCPFAGQTSEEQSKSITEQRSVYSSLSNPIEPSFNVIWHKLTYKVDSRPWYTKVRQRLSRPSRAEPNSVCNKKKVILNQLCGDAKSRQLIAIMGPSGSGKSTLLNCLFQNRTIGTTGRILVEGHSRRKLKVCFIPQNDYLNEWLTVREDLTFVSKLKLARMDNELFNNGSTNSTDRGNTENVSYVKKSGPRCRTSLIDHEANVLSVSELLGLNICLDVPIKRISGGQKKRLSIARELMSKPDVLILDEPTTGLDSLTCFKTIKVLRDLAQLSQNPMLVVVTIHQPQKEVFNLFDKTYFLSNKGVIYDGCPKNVVETIRNVAKVELPLPDYNPASFLIEVASDEGQTGVRELLATHQRAKFDENHSVSYLRTLMHSKSNYSQNWNICAVEDNNSTCSDIDTRRQSMAAGNHAMKIMSHPAESSNSANLSLEDGLIGTDNYYISYQLRNCLSSHSNNLIQSFRHVFILTHRSWLSVIRNPTFTKSRLAFHTLLPLMMLAVFGSQMGIPNNCPKTETELNVEDMLKNIKGNIVARNVEETRLSFENVSFFFMLMYGFGINIISCTASFYPLTMHMFKKEMINGLYSASPYFVGQMLAELPLEIIFPTISILLAYPLSGQLSSFMEWRMLAVAYVIFLVSYSIHSLGLLCGSIFVKNVSVAVLTGQILLLPFVMLSGFLIRTERMPDWMRNLSHISPFKHGLSAIVSARYGFNVCGCDEDMLPETSGPIQINGMSPQMRNVVEYMFPKKNSSDLSNNSDDEFAVTDIFDRLGQQFIKAQTFGLDMKTCDDVKPHLMHIFDVHDSSLLYGIVWLILIIIVLKFATFSIMKSFPYRIN